mgnify:CR=1 FL=1
MTSSQDLCFLVGSLLSNSSNSSSLPSGSLVSSTSGFSAAFSVGANEGFGVVLTGSLLIVALSTVSFGCSELVRLGLLLFSITSGVLGVVAFNVAENMDKQEVIFFRFCLRLLL